MSFRDAVPAAVWQDLVGAGRLTRYRGGGILVQQGGQAKCVVVVVSGGMKVVHLAEDGSSSVLALRGHGELVGELGVIFDKPHSATVSAIGASVGYRVPAPTFRRLAEQHRLQQAIFQVAVDRMHEAEQLHADLQRPALSARLSRLIIHLAERVGRSCDEGLVIDLGMPREELAGMAVMSRSSAISILSEMQEDGVLALGRGRVTVKDLGALGAIANQGQDARERRKA